jgi:membrane protein implicated in regulation of membrane protease activity
MMGVTVMGIPLTLPTVDLYVALLISAVISFIITYLFYRMALKNAEHFLIRAEV